MKAKYQVPSLSHYFWTLSKKEQLGWTQNTKTNKKELLKGYLEPILEKRSTHVISLPPPPTSLPQKKKC